VGSEGPGGLTPDLDQTPKVGDETWGGEGPQAPASQPASPAFDPFTRPDWRKVVALRSCHRKEKQTPKGYRYGACKAVCFFAPPPPPHPLIASGYYQYGVNYRFSHNEDGQEVG